MKNLVENKQYTFVAQNATPLGGRMIHLNPIFDVRVSGDTIVSELPYYGRAFVAPIGRTDGGIRFVSTKQDYILKQRKKGGWDVTIKPKDARDVREMNFRIGKTGYTSLTVTSNNRQMINFNGYIMQNNKKSL